MRWWPFGRQQGDDDGTAENAPSGRIVFGRLPGDGELGYASAEEVYGDLTVQRCVNVLSNQAASVLCSPNTRIVGRDGAEVQRPGIRNLFTVRVGEQPARQWWRDLIADMLVYGNAMARIVRASSPRGSAVMLVRLPLRDLRIERTAAGLVYHAPGVSMPLVERDVLHIRYAVIGDEAGFDAGRGDAARLVGGARNPVRDLSRQVAVIRACDTMLAMWGRGGIDTRRVGVKVAHRNVSAQEIQTLVRIFREGLKANEQPLVVTGDEVIWTEIRYAEVLASRQAAMQTVMGYYGVPPVMMGFSSGLAGTGIDALRWQPWLFSTQAAVESVVGQADVKLLASGNHLVYDKARLLLGDPVGLQKMLPSLANVLTLAEVRSILDLPAEMEGPMYSGMSGSASVDGMEDDRNAPPGDTEPE